MEKVSRDKRENNINYQPEMHVRNANSREIFKNNRLTSQFLRNYTDIPLLAKAFTFKIARRLGRNIDSIPAETLRILSNMEWPGNVRELENVIERAVLLTRGNVLQLSLPDIALPEPETPPAATVVAQEGEDEYQLIVRVLKETNGVVAGPKGAAQLLGLKRTTLLSRMKRLGIDKSALI